MLPLRVHAERKVGVLTKQNVESYISNLAYVILNDNNRLIIIFISTESENYTTYRGLTNSEKSARAAFEI